MHPQSKWRLYVVLSLLLISTPALAQEEAAESRNVIRGGRNAIDDVASGVGESLPKREIYQKTLKGTVWIRNVRDGQTSMGTGSLVDADKRLVLTNHHVIDGFKGPLEVYFPVVKDGELMTDPNYYLRRIRPIQGTVIDSDSKVDLALIQLEEIPVTAEALKLTAHGLVPGEEVHSVAGLPQGSSALWIYTTGVVRQVYRRQALLEDQLVDAMVVETQAPVNAGNSGGPVVNDRAELAAVVSFGRPDANLVECFIDRSEVKDYLNITIPLVNPTTSEQYATRARRQLSEQRYDLALDDFNKAIQLDPKDAAAYAGRGKVFLRQKDFQSAIGDFNEALQLSPKLFAGFLGRGMTYREMGKDEESIKDLTDAIRNVTDDGELYDVLNERGITHYWNGRYTEAADDFTKSIEHLERKEKAADRVTILLLRDKAQIYANRGDARHMNGENEPALGDMQTAIRINPKMASFWSTLAGIRKALGQNDDAIACYSQAIALAPTDAAYLRSRAEVLSEAGKSQEALADYVKAVEVEPSNPENMNLVGVALYQMKEYGLAFGAFEKALAIDSTVAMYHNNRADACYELKNYPEAIKSYTTAMQYDSSNAMFYSSRGLAYEAAGDMTAAKTDLKKAAEMDPERYKFHDRRYLAVTNDSSEPIKVYVQYHTLGSDGQWRWYPDGYQNGTAVVFDLDNGSTWNLYHDEYRILSDRVKIWAVGKNSGDTWSANKTVDCITTSSCGYLTDQVAPATYTYRFYE